MRRSLRTVPGPESALLDEHELLASVCEATVKGLSSRSDWPSRKGMARGSLWSLKTKFEQSGFRGCRKVFWERGRRWAKIYP